MDQAHKLICAINVTWCGCSNHCRFGNRKGMVIDGEYAILSDIQGLEDAFGDMDFKVAGTPKGCNANGY